MQKAIYPGTFDPVTNGHLDIVNRVNFLFDQLIVAVVKNPPKACLFSYSERINLAKKVTKGIKGVEVLGFEGLVIDFARQNKANAIIRGLRTMSDFEYEFKMALTNKSLAPTIETLFLMTQPQYSFISSHLIKEVALLGGDLNKFLPGAVFEAVNKKVNEGCDWKNN
ncbi:MAG: pantetheine-phosphate adenylyltransferase [Candidatus Omnitrophica bacterium]|nr:pantetheine-phosphate adenylyltransferase [Candidatus Omnitrophota bacterium]MCF7876857.1 pantetheine-phosphate adenylyltransferase [Candidatus Omnitrophota bacterium]MCF7877884.1 pantetheine-phosphate adenylyltransferase [Candidatus Omnitrophota bacterium]MCF7892576.1 pantetheine-phosphate adenylyltransferase [Candidatus Omnitrophota bacterium]